MKGKTRALIVDDEPAARRLLFRLLEEHDDIEVVGQCGHGAEARAWFEENSADLLFLDIRMPGMNGFQLLDSLGSPPGAVVFVTAYDAFAIRAFEAEAWDYLLKPYDDERLAQTLERVRRRFERESSPEEGRTPPLLDRIAVARGRKRLTLRLEDVFWIGAESNYVRFHLEHESYLARRSLTGLEQRLDPKRFVRVHRSAIVNIERVERFEPKGHGDLRLVLDNGETVTLSRRYREPFEGLIEILS